MDALVTFPPPFSVENGATEALIALQRGSPLPPAIAAKVAAQRPEVDALADEIAVAPSTSDAAMHRLLTAIRRFDALGGWAWQGAKSCAHWLSWRTGDGLGTAREKDSRGARARWSSSDR